MRRLIHSLGRWRGTHCDRCGRRVAENQSAEATTGGRRLVHFFTDRDCAGNTGANLLRALRERLRYRYPALTDEQLAGHACVHCGHRFDDRDHPVPADRRGTRRQCAYYCRIETATGLTAAFTGRIRPSRRPAVQFTDLSATATLASWPKATVYVTDEHGGAHSDLVPLETAKRLAEQAKRLGFNTAIIRHDPPGGTR